VQSVYGELRRADRVFSTYRADSEISLLRTGALARELASAEVREVLALCEQARVLTGGFFDADIPQPDGGRVLDPSGLVKGWAVEKAAGVLDQVDGNDWLVNAGGDVIGRAAYGPAWRVAIEDPADRSRVLGVVSLTAGAVATSGTAARGRHIIDPRTGEPAEDVLRSATVVGPSLTWADVLATAAFVEGTASLPRIDAIDGYDVVLVEGDGRLLASDPAVLEAATPG
jgi:thiamine biosynthesis lipoprotein